MSDVVTDPRMRIIKCIQKPVHDEAGLIDAWVAFETSISAETGLAALWRLFSHEHFSECRQCAKDVIHLMGEKASYLIENKRLPSWISLRGLFTEENSA